MSDPLPAPVFNAVFDETDRHRLWLRSRHRASRRESEKFPQGGSDKTGAILLNRANINRQRQNPMSLV
jgi:hypothetical protein